VKLNLQEVEWGGMDWIYLAQVPGLCDCGNEFSGSIKEREVLN